MGNPAMPRETGGVSGRLPQARKRHNACRRQDRTARRFSSMRRAKRANGPGMATSSREAARNDRATWFPIVSPEQTATLKFRNHESTKSLNAPGKIRRQDVEPVSGTSTNHCSSASAMRFGVPHNTQWPRAAAVKLYRSRNVMFSRRAASNNTREKVRVPWPEAAPAPAHPGDGRTRRSRAGC